MCFFFCPCRQSAHEWIRPFLPWRRFDSPLAVRLATRRRIDVSSEIVGFAGMVSVFFLFFSYVRPWLSVVFTCRVRHAFQDSPNAGVPLNTRVAPPMIPPPAFPPSSSQMGFTPGSIPPGFMASAPMGIGPPGIPPPFIPPYNMNMPGKYRNTPPVVLRWTLQTKRPILLFENGVCRATFIWFSMSTMCVCVLTKSAPIGFFFIDHMTLIHLFYLYYNFTEQSHSARLPSVNQIIMEVRFSITFVYLYFFSIENCDVHFYVYF